MKPCKVFWDFLWVWIWHQTATAKQRQRDTKTTTKKCKTARLACHCSPSAHYVFCQIPAICLQNNSGWFACWTLKTCLQPRDLKMITRKQRPLQSPTPTRALVRLRADHVSDGATASFQLPLVCCKGIIPANPLFSSVHPTHTAASLNTGTTTSGVNERSTSKEINKFKKKLLCRFSKDCQHGESVFF